MRGRIRALGVVGTLTALACVASVALANKPKISVVTGKSVVPENAQGAAEAKCGRGSSLTGLGFGYEHHTKFDGRSSLNTIAPVTGRQLRVFLDNKDSGGGAKIKAIGLCRGDGSFFMVSKPQTIFSGGPQFGSVTAKCPRGSSVVGGGGTLSEGFNQQQLLASKPKGTRGWTISAFTVDSGTETATAICDKKHSYVTKSAKRTLQFRAAADKAKRTNIEDLEATAKCPNNDSIMSGGFDVADNSEPTVLDLRPKRHDAWFARARYFGFSQASLTTYAICRKNG